MREVGGSTGSHTYKNETNVSELIPNLPPLQFNKLDERGKQNLILTVAMASLSFLAYDCHPSMGSAVVKVQQNLKEKI